MDPDQCDRRRRSSVPWSLKFLDVAICIETHTTGLIGHSSVSRRRTSNHPATHRAVTHNQLFLGASMRDETERCHLFYMSHLRPLATPHYGKHFEVSPRRTQPNDS